jgi:hypothetical protein
VGEAGEQPPCYPKTVDPFHRRVCMQRLVFRDTDMTLGKITITIDEILQFRVGIMILWFLFPKL